MKKISAAVIFILFLAFHSAMAQITIAPTMVFIDQQNRFGTFLVLNGSDEAQEVSVEFPFGYPVTTGEGEIQMVYDDSSAAEEYGLNNIVRGFPRNFVLQPGQRQVVRVTIQPKNFSDGTYWTRIRTTSTAETPPIAEQTDDEIRAQITYKFEQVTTLFYKHGDTNTGIEINDLFVSQKDDVHEFTADVTRTGNSPFLGSIILTVYDAGGNEVLSRTTSTSIYFDYLQVFEVPKDRLTSGDYRAEITFETQRPDVSRDDIIQMEPVTRSLSFTVE